MVLGFQPPIAHPSPKNAPIMNHAVSIPASFDYIIVGAGATGCVLANRLSQNPHCRVLLIEAGSRDHNGAIHQPSGLLSLWGGELDWQHSTEPQAGLGGRSILLSQGKVLGGSSSINAMIYTRGHRRDFDYWKRLGNEGWGYQDVLPYFLKSENFLGQPSEFHGRSGELTVQTCPNPTEIAQAFAQSGLALGYGQDWDFNGAQQERGTGLYQVTVNAEGKRCSAATAFLKPILYRPNLTVLTDTEVTQISIENDRAIGVLLQQGETIRADREVIISAGAIGSPKLLMLSGIGNAQALNHHGIAVNCDLPGVGQNLQDHLMLMLPYQAKQAMPIPEYLGEAGLFVNTGSDLVVDASDLQVHFTGNMQPLLGGKDLGPVFFACPTLLKPESLGEVKLRSNQFDDPLEINPNYLRCDRDVDVLLQGIHLVRELVHSDVMAPFLASELAPGLAADPQTLRSFIRSQASTIWHPSGTCKMGQDETAVVDAQLRVHGIAQLRVADASIMPRIISANLQATCMMIGERAADLILHP
jgi:choline dehydrogenase